MLKKYKPFFKAGAQETLAFRGAILMWFIITIIEVSCTVFLWNAIYKNSTTEVINGFKFEEIITYFVFTNIVSFMCFGGNTMWTINEEIRKGTICMSFTKPISYRGRFIMTTLGSVSMSMIMIGLPLYTISYIVFSILGFIKIVSFWSTLFSITAFIILSFLSVLLFDAIDYMLGIVCFYTVGAWGMNLAKNVIMSFLGGAMLPLAFFKFGNVDLSVVFNYFPFAGVIQNPVMALLGDYSSSSTYLHVIHTIGLSLTWIFVLEIFNHFFFKHASKKVTVQGG